MSLFNPAELAELSCSDRENVTIELFNQAIQKEDYDTASEVADYVLEFNTPFSYGWKLHCVQWVTHYRIKLWQNTEDGSPESEKYGKLIFDHLWQYKWVVDYLSEDLSVSLETINEVTEEMENLYRHFDFSLGMVEKAKMLQAIRLGNEPAAREYFERWQKAGDSSLDDCEACLQDNLIKYYHFIGEHSRVLELAEPILSGKMTCGEVPQVSFRYIISSLMKLGKVEEAKNTLYDAINVIEKEIDEFVYLIPELVQFACRLGLYETAEELMDNHNDRILNVVQNNHFYGLHYLIACSFFNEEAKEQAQDLARKFDERNGTEYYQTYLSFLFSSPKLH